MKLKQISGTIGTAAQYDVGTSANNIVQLDGSGKLPALDGSQLNPAPTASGGSESSSAIPKYDLIDVSQSATINITSSSPATLASMNVYLVDMSSATHVDLYLPAASDLDDGEYIVIVHKSNSSSTGKNAYIKVHASGSDYLYTHSNQSYARFRRTGSSSFVSNGVDKWYHGTGIGQT